MDNHFNLADFLVSPEGHGQVAHAAQEFAQGRVAERLENFEEARAQTHEDDEFWEYASWARPYVVKDGTLVVPVKGVLLNDFPFAFGSLATGYEYIAAAMLRGASDPQVDQIVLNVSSGGGIVTGCFDCADLIHEIAQEKEVHAVANEHAYSAAYALASSASRLTVARTGGVGSIGVISAHVSIARMLENAGIEFTFVTADKNDRKTDGRPELPLSEEAEKHMRERANAIHDIFVATVARNRGLDEQTVRDTNAATFLPQQAIEIGLADAIGTLDATLSAYAENITQNGDEQMSKDTKAAGQAATPNTSTEENQPDLDAVRAEARAEGMTAERERVKAIRSSDEAAERPAALEAVIEMGLSAEDSVAFLAKLPKEATAEEAENEGGQSSFEAHMNGGDHPNVGAGEGKGGESAEQPSRVERAFKTAGLDYSAHVNGGKSA